MGKAKKRSRDKNTEEKILKKLRKLEKKLRRKQNIDQEDSDDPVLDKENRPVNVSVHNLTANDISIEDTSIRDGDPSQAIPQIPDSEIEVMDLFSGPSKEKSRDFEGEVNNTAVEAKQLDEETKKILGEDPESGKQKEIDLHPDLAARWLKWKEGLPKEAKADVFAKYSRKGNLSLEAPTLNAEIAATLNEAGSKRDNLFIQEQNLAGTALASLGDAISMILKDEEDPIDRMKLLERLADTGKLLTHLHFQISAARKAFIAPILTKQVKDLLQKTTPGDFLYGDKVGEVIKSAKTMEKLGKEIKMQRIPQVLATASKKPNPRYSGRSLNWRGPGARPRTSNQGYRPQASKFSKNQQNKTKQAPQTRAQSTQEEKQ